MVKVLTYGIPDYKIKLKIRQLQVMGRKNARQINNTSYEWYIGSKSMQSPGALDRVSVTCLMHNILANFINLTIGKSNEL